jgi:inhibitor of cysteine peptidase
MKRFVLFTLLIVTVTFTVFAAASMARKSTEVHSATEPNEHASYSLPKVGSYDRLKTLLAEAHEARIHYFDGMAVDMVAQASEGAALTMKSKASDQAQTDNNAAYSGTNVQVQGVDESDVVKTDGKYIYQVNGRKIRIAEAYPAEKMKWVATIDFKPENFQPHEIYVDDKYLVVIGSAYAEPNVNKYYASYRGLRSVKAKIYDITNKADIKKPRVAELEGHYVSSRKIGASLYFIANRYIDSHYILNEKKAEDAPEFPTPFYRDTAVSMTRSSIAYDQIHYFPGPVEPNYLIIGSLNLDEPRKPMQVSTYLGSGSNIYASQHNLFIAVSKYNLEEASVEKIPTQSSTTAIYKFLLDQGIVEFTAQGEVPGTILNQFSMDEHEGHFRIATTRGDMRRTDEFTSKNNVYILNGDLMPTGKIEDIAPGERIYSVRFMGDRGYIVTFKTVDPLFVIDLKNPQAPKILGALKIPGYSDYLHPYDENHIIGIGKETVEVTRKDGKGNNDTMAFYLGMKLAIFDVTDVANPIEKFKETIGGRGTYSELLHNHKALLFSKTKNLLAFPVTVMEVKGRKEANREPQFPEVPPHGEFTFQGAYVYHIDLEQGFKLRGKLSHLTEQEVKKAGRHWYDSKKDVQRLLYINETLYTLSRSMIKAHEWDTLKDSGILYAEE